MKKVMMMAIVAMFIVPLVLAACAPAAVATAPPKSPATPPPSESKPAWQTKWDATLAAAKKEGKVVVVTFIGSETRDALMKNFSSKYGIDIEFIPGAWAETLVKIQAERRAGLYNADVIINGNSATFAFRDQDLLDSIEPALLRPEVSDPKNYFGDEINYFDARKTAIGMLAQYNSFVTRNTEQVKENEVTSLRDLLQPRWKDKVTVYDPSIGGTGAALFAMLALEEWNVDEASQWLGQMIKQQGMIVSRDPRQQMEWLAKGKNPIALAVYTDQLVNFLANGAPIAQQKVKEPGIVTSSTAGLALINKAAHPNAAAVFITWILSQEGQTAFTSGFGGPSRRKDVKVTGAFAALTPPTGEKLYIEDEDKARKKNELMKTSAQVIAAAK